MVKDVLIHCASKLMNFIAFPILHRIFVSVIVMSPPVDLNAYFLDYFMYNLHAVLSMLLFLYSISP